MARNKKLAELQKERAAQNKAKKAPEKLWQLPPNPHMPLLKGPTKENQRKVRSPTESLFQFKITLKNIEPPIWRRILVPDGTLNDLHYQIQRAFGWQNDHMHQFLIDKIYYCESAGDSYDNSQDETDVLLSDLIDTASRKKPRWEYEYDFGDSWKHLIQYEKSPPRDPHEKYPQCLDGARACPPEDCGGTYGYDDLLEALADPEHPDHEDKQEWLGEFNPEAFDAKAATKAMGR